MTEQRVETDIGTEAGAIGRESIPAAEMRGISKAFGSVQAVAHADIRLYSGEIHALVGGNGSGKSTLTGVLSGAHQPDAGDIFIDGAKTVLAQAENRA